jgi:GPH family glycoside/pentoside/hexuronide:cation symporter
VTTPIPAAPPSHDDDASRKEIILYGLANIGPALGNQFFGIVNLITVVAMGVSPLLMGLVMGIKTFWDALTDPVMAQVSDNTHSRWGRRRPYIFIGGISQVLFLSLVLAFFPKNDKLKTNAELAHLRQAQTAPAAAGVTTGTLATATLAAPPALAKGTSPWANIRQGIQAFSDPANANQRTVVLYLLVVYLIFTTLTTITSVPYFALGIELCPSYNGRTRVVTYRAMVDNCCGLIGPWVGPFCYMTVFATALDGLRWVAAAAALIGVPCVVLMVRYTRERTHVSVQKTGARRVGMFTSMWYVFRNVHALRIFALYQLIGLSTGLFQQVGAFLNIYWVMGSVQKGASLGAAVSMVAWAIGLAMLPVLNWACRRYQKHFTLRIAVVWMSIGCVLKWWCMNPQHPELQFILPFFFSIGIASVYTVLGTMIADVTDVDELATGSRREGMFGAAISFLSKSVGSLTPMLAGAILVLSGFNPALRAQAPATIYNMRLMYSFVPAGMLLLSLLLLWRYPLTAARMAEIKAEIKRRRDAAIAMPAPPLCS